MVNNRLIIVSVRFVHSRELRALLVFRAKWYDIYSSYVYD